jgi:hypothetical protein
MGISSLFPLKRLTLKKCTPAILALERLWGRIISFEIVRPYLKKTKQQNLNSDRHMNISLASLP